VSSNGGIRLVRLDRRASVFVLTMDDGENRMNRAWLDEMNTALDEVDSSPDPLALVTAGTGKFFSNGLDLDWLLGGEVDMPRFVAEVERIFARVIAAPYVTVAACNGHTFAAGAMLALAHDFRVMRADRGFFCLPEVDIGIPFTPGMNSLITTRMPVTTAHDLMVTGRRVGGEEAARLGIVHHAVPEDRVLPASVELATEHAGKDRTTLTTIKQRMYEETIKLLSNSPGTQPSA
jgi:enoyl-CoA hydratase/carnithine racemase